LSWLSLDRFPAVGSLDRARRALYKLVWEDWFRHSDLLASIDGYRTSVSGTAAIALRYGWVTLETGTTALSVARVMKGEVMKHTFQPSWDKVRMVRFGVLGFTSDVNQDVRLFTGMDGLTEPHVGFRVVDATLYAHAGDGVASAEKDIATIAVDTPYLLEVRLLPPARAEFYVDGVLKAVLTENLPSGTAEAERLMVLYITNTAAEIKKLRVSTWEFLQER